eukprot:6613535-Pyramimonas_sp.AAC.1
MSENTGGRSLPKYQVSSRRAKTASEVTKRRPYSNDPIQREEGWQCVFLTGYDVLPTFAPFAPFKRPT